MEIKRVETYSLFEFCQVIQENILNGWRFDFDSNENAPIAFGSMLVTGMVKAQPKIKGPTELVTEDNTAEAPVVNTETKRGRKSKE
jgi:hypothetical protein